MSSAEVPQQTEAEPKDFDPNKYVVGDGPFLLHVAFRRKHFLPAGNELQPFYNQLKILVQADAPTCHHYELVCWFTRYGSEPFYAGCLNLSFDWLEKSYKGESFLDNVVTLFKDRPARLAKSNWFPNADPSDSDLQYEYLYIGSRMINHHDVFAPFVNEQGEFTGGIDLNKPFGVEHYSLSSMCCYTFAEMVMRKFLNIEESLDDKANAGPWLSYQEFLRKF